MGLTQGFQSGLSALHLFVWRNDCGQGAPGYGQFVISVAWQLPCPDPKALQPRLRDAGVRVTLESGSLASKAKPPWGGIQPTWAPVSLRPDQAVCNGQGVVSMEYLRAKSSISTFYVFRLDVYFKSQQFTNRSNAHSLRSGKSQ